MPSSRAASKPSRRTTTNVAPIGYSATILTFAEGLKSSTKMYVPGLSARTRILTVLPAGTTFSILRSLFSTSTAFFGSLLVTTSTNAWPALTLSSAGSNAWFAAVSGTSTVLSCACAAVNGAMSVPRATTTSTDDLTSRLIAASWQCDGGAELGIPNHENIVNLTQDAAAGPRGL